MYLPKKYRSISSPDLVKFKCHCLSGIKIKVNYGMTENKFLIKKDTVHHLHELQLH